ncbi:MAG: hypothetical protein N4A45_11210 [Flavobacteriales bacterium]|nr:hypothetical protein [Flavobacteriales bacterium]
MRTHFSLGLSFRKRQINHTLLWEFYYEDLKSNHTTIQQGVLRAQRVSSRRFLRHGLNYIRSKEHKITPSIILDYGFNLSLLLQPNSVFLSEYIDKTEELFDFSRAVGTVNQLGVRTGLNIRVSYRLNKFRLGLHLDSYLEGIYESNVDIMETFYLKNIQQFSKNYPNTYTTTWTFIPYRMGIHLEYHIK